MNWIAATIRSLTGDVRALDVAVVDGAGAQLTGFDASRPAAAAETNPSLNQVSAVLLTANAARRKFFINNTTGSTLYAKFGTAASPTSYTILVPKNGSYESDTDGYTGVIHAVLASGTAAPIVTEVTTT